MYYYVCWRHSVETNSSVSCHVWDIVMHNIVKDGCVSANTIGLSSNGAVLILD